MENRRWKKSKVLEKLLDRKFQPSHTILGLLFIVNEKNKYIHDICDGNSIQCTFRRIVSDNMYRKWEEVVQLASTITFNSKHDGMIWTFNSNGVYSSQSLCRVINNRGVTLVHLPAIWILKVPPRVHILPVAAN